MIGMAGVVLVAGGCVDRGAQKQAKRTEELVSDPVVTVTAQPVGFQTLTENLEITGQVTTASDTQIGAKQSGRIVSVFVKDGDPVTPGQTIAVQDTTSLNAQLSQALASVQTALAGTQSANAALSQALQNARIQPTKTASQVRQAEAALRSAKAQLGKAIKGARTEDRVQAEWAVRQAKSNLDKAQKDLDRYTKLVEEGAVARTQLEAAQNVYNQSLAAYNAALQQQLVLSNGTRPEDIEVAREAVRQAEESLKNAQAQQSLDVNLNEQVLAARAQVNSSRAQLQSAQAQVIIARQAISEAVIKAPFMGKIAGNPIQPGAVVGPGTPVARIVGREGSYFEGEVPETNIEKVAKGAIVAIKVSALNEMTFSGVVKAISPTGESVGRLFHVRIAFTGDTAALKPGMYATGMITLRTVPNAATVPVTSIVKRNGKDVVFIVDGAIAKAVPVTTGLKTDGVIQVEGLSANQRVIVAGQNSLDDGSKIKLEGDKPKTEGA